MAISSLAATDNLPAATELLDVWRSQMYINIWHYNQVLGPDAPLIGDENCRVFVQPERERVARAMCDAYDMMQRYLGYSPTPRYYSEVIPLGMGLASLQQLQTKTGYLIEFGKRATELVEADVAISYSQSNPALTQNDTATITVTTTAPADEVHVFFRTADGAPADADERYRIMPLTVTKSGNTATITGHRSLFVQPSIWSLPYLGTNYEERNDAQTDDASDFVTQVDVYRVYTDATDSVEIIGDPIWTQCTELDSNIVGTAVARVLDNDLGIFQVRRETCTSSCEPRYWQAVRVHYKAGLPLQNGQMDDVMARAMARLANTLMPDYPCPLCGYTLGKFDADRKEGRPSASIINNPFGVLEGQIAAWRVVHQQKIYRGSKATRTRRW